MRVMLVANEILPVTYRLQKLKDSFKTGLVSQLLFQML